MDANSDNALSQFKPVDWECALVAFLAEKERRSGSKRTPEEYRRVLLRFFGQLGKTPPEVTSAEVFAYVHATGLSGREPAAATINLRLAAISSFYGFLLRMDLATVNPCSRVQRPQHEPPPARGLDQA